MNAFEKKIFSFCNKYNLFKNCKGLILAVSGGPDSMALLGFFEKNRDSFSFPLLCATVDHSIRRESEEEAAYVEKFCSKRGIPFEKLVVDIPSLCPKGVSTETFSRNVRYDFFFSLKEKYSFSHIATAHTSDDNAETVLMNIIRGCSVSGLAGIPVSRPDGVVRPLLCCEKSELINYCVDEKIQYFIDSTNAENIYRRNVVRNVIIPVLEKENPSIRGALNRLSVSAGIDDSFIDSFAEKIAKGININERRKFASIPISLWEENNKAVFSRLIRKVFSRLSGKELSFSMTEDVLSLFDNKFTSNKVQLFDFYALRTYSSVDFIKIDVEEGKNNEFLQIKAKINTEIPFFDGIIKIVERKSPHKKNRDCIPKINMDDAVFRTRKSGDVFKNTKSGRKLIRRLFIDKKIPFGIRDKVPLLEKNGEILWAFGLGAAADRRADDCDEFYEVIFKLKNQVK